MPHANLTFWTHQGYGQQGGYSGGQGQGYGAPAQGGYQSGGYGGQSALAWCRSLAQADWHSMCPFGLSRRRRLCSAGSAKPWKLRRQRWRIRIRWCQQRYRLLSVIGISSLTSSPKVSGPSKCNSLPIPHASAQYNLSTSTSTVYAPRKLSRSAILCPVLP